MIDRTSARLDQSVKVDKMTTGEQMENTVKVTAACIALGASLAIAGFFIAAAACFVLAAISDLRHRA